MTTDKLTQPIWDRIGIPEIEYRETWESPPKPEREFHGARGVYSPVNSIEFDGTDDSISTTTGRQDWGEYTE